MQLKAFILFLLTGIAGAGYGQQATAQAGDSVKYIFDASQLTSDTIDLHEVSIVAFKSRDEWTQYYQYKSRIEKVLPYVRVAKQLYAEVHDEKENDKKRAYHRYRKDLEKEMRGKFEKELKDLTVGQGEMLFKLLNRETGNNAYNIIKEIKSPFTAWVYQMVAKKYGYNLKDTYDPKKEKMIELIIRQMGPAYNVKS